MESDTDTDTALCGGRAMIATASDRFLEAARFSESARGIAEGLDEVVSTREREQAIADADRAAGRAVEALEGARRLLDAQRPRPTESSW